MADFLRATNVARWATPLCAALTAADDTARDEAAQLLALEPASVLDAVLRGLPPTQPHLPLATLVARVPPFARAAAARSCVQADPAFASACSLPLADMVTSELVLSALAGMRDVTGVQFIVPPDLLVPADSLLDRIGTLAPLLCALPHLRDLSLRSHHDTRSAAAAAAALAKHLSRLTQLTRVALCGRATCYSQTEHVCAAPHAATRDHSQQQALLPPLPPSFAALPDLADLRLAVNRQVSDACSSTDSALSPLELFPNVTRLELIYACAQLSMPPRQHAGSHEHAPGSASFMAVRQLILHAPCDRHLPCPTLWRGAVEMPKLTRLELHLPQQAARHTTRYSSGTHSPDWALLSHLQHLIASGVNEDVAAALAPLTQLTHVELCGYGSTALWSVLGTLRRLRCLDLYRCRGMMFKGPGTLALQAALAQLPGLTHLALSGDARSESYGNVSICAVLADAPALRALRVTTEWGWADLAAPGASLAAFAHFTRLALACPRTVHRARSARAIDVILAPSELRRLEFDIASAFSKATCI